MNRLKVYYVALIARFSKAAFLSVPAERDSLNLHDPEIYSVKMLPVAP